MRRTLKSLIILIALTAVLTSCANPFSGDKGGSSNKSAYSEISFDAANYSPGVAPQSIKIRLGKNRTWKLRVNVHYSNDDAIRVAMQATSITDPTAAKRLDLGDGVSDKVHVETISSSIDYNKNVPFVVTLVAGRYYIALNGQKTDTEVVVVP